MSTRTLFIFLAFFGVFLLGIAFFAVQQNALPLTLEKKFVFQVPTSSSGIQELPSPFPSGNSASGSVFVISSIIGPPFSYPDQSGSLDKSIREAFRRLQINLNITNLPSERSLQSADAGIIDGDMARISGLESQYPHLIMIPEKLFDFEWGVFTRKNDLDVKTWESLRPYHVGVINGWKFLEKNLPGTRSLAKVDSYQQLFEILSLGRVDLVIYSREGGFEAIKTMNLHGIVCLEPPFAITPMFLYLNQRHASLIAPLAETFRLMKLDGTWERLSSRTKADR